MSGKTERFGEIERYLYFEVLFSTVIQAYDKGVIIEGMLQETADILGWDKGLAEQYMDIFFDEVRAARELNRRFIVQEPD